MKFNRSSIQTRRRAPVSRTGFTLIDVTVSVLIIGISSAVAVPRFFHMMDAYRADAAAEKLRSDLEFARGLAVAQSRAIDVEFAPRSNEYTLLEVDDPAHPGKPYRVQLGADPYRAALVSVVPGVGGVSRSRRQSRLLSNSVQFDRFGRPDRRVVIRLKSGSVRRRIIIDPESGHAKIK